MIKSLQFYYFNWRKYEGVNSNSLNHKIAHDNYIGGDIKV